VHTRILASVERWRENVSFEEHDSEEQGYHARMKSRRTTDVAYVGTVCKGGKQSAWAMCDTAKQLQEVRCCSPPCAATVNPLIPDRLGPRP
jgi:hypothetical protein